jgi:hypothetical protein
VLKSIAVAAGACALVAGAAVAGNAAHASPSVPSAAQARSADVDLTALGGSDVGTDPGTAPGAAGTANGAVGQGRVKMCARVPLAIQRTQDLEKRLAADVTTPGSLAYLQRRIDVAQATHKGQLVTTLTNRMTYRKQLATFLPQRLALLQTAQRTVCAPPSGTATS